MFVHFSRFKHSPFFEVVKIESDFNASYDYGNRNLQFLSFFEMNEQNEDMEMNSFVSIIYVQSPN